MNRLPEELAGAILCDAGGVSRAASKGTRAIMERACSHLHLRFVPENVPAPRAVWRLVRRLPHLTSVTVRTCYGEKMRAEHLQAIVHAGTRLRKLRLPHNVDLRDVAVATGPIEELRLGSLQPTALDMPCLGYLERFATTLRVLHVQGALNVTDLDGLAECRLTELDMSGARLTSLAPLKGSAATLRVLRLTHGGAVTDGHDLLACCTVLETLDVRSTQIRVPQSLTSLRDLNVAATGLCDLRTLPLQGLTQLIVRNNPIRSLVGIASATNLRELDISYTDAARALEPLAGLTALTQLNIACHETGLPHLDLRPLAGLTQLTELNIDCDKPDYDLRPLAGLTRLTSLKVGFDGDMTADEEVQGYYDDDIVVAVFALRAPAVYGCIAHLPSLRVSFDV